MKNNVLSFPVDAHARYRLSVANPSPPIPDDLLKQAWDDLDEVVKAENLERTKEKR